MEVPFAYPVRATMSGQRAAKPTAQILPDVEPIAYPDCCLALSVRIVKTLKTALPQGPDFTLSVGSGSGLLESMLIEMGLIVRGVETAENTNIYIPSHYMHTVPGSFAVSPMARDAKAWLFIYPRDPRLLAKYLDQFGDGNVAVIVWAGPQNDWPDYAAVWRPYSKHSYAKANDWTIIESLDDPTAEYEKMVIICKTSSLPVEKGSEQA